MKDLFSKIFAVTFVASVWVYSFLVREPDPIVYQEISRVGSRDISDLKIALFAMDIGDGNEFVIQATDSFQNLSTLYEFTGEVYTMESGEDIWYQQALSLCLEDYDLLIALGWQAMDVFALLKNQFPQVDFVLIGPDLVLSGVKSISFEIVEGAFILGALLAAAFPEEDVFGYVGCFQTYTMGEYCYGFLQGLQYINPSATLKMRFTEDYTNVELAYDKTMELAEEGVSVVIAGVSSVGNEGVFLAIEQQADLGHQMYSTSLDVDQTSPERPYILSGLTRNTGYALERLIYEYVQEVYSPQPWRLSLTEMACSVLSVTSHKENYRNEEILTDEVIAQAREVYKAVMTGQIDLGI